MFDFAEKSHNYGTYIDFALGFCRIFYLANGPIEDNLNQFWKFNRSFHRYSKVKLTNLGVFKRIFEGEQ